MTAVAPITWFGGRYIDDRPENFFAQLATDPDEYLKVASDKIVPPDQLKAWQQDRAGALVDVTLAKKYGWKIGDHVTLQGTIFPANLDLTIRAIYHRDPPQNALYFNAKYLEEAVPWFKGQAGWYSAQIDSPDNVSRASQEIDDMFRNSPLQTKTESEKAFQLGFVASLGNIKAFILGICGAVVFTIMLVSANTMAMSVRSRTREVAVLKTFGFTRAARAVDIRERVGGFGCCGRSARSSGRGSSDLVPDPQLHRAGNSALHESECADGCLFVAGGFVPGTGERLSAGVQRVAHEHCGWLAAHWIM